MSKSVTNQWQDILKQIKEDAAKGIREGIVEATKTGVKLLREYSPRSALGSRAGRYASGWRSDVDSYAGVSTEAYIYNKTDWQLTHLLEKGHDIKNRFSNGRSLGHYGGVEHILKAENEVFAILIREIPVRISRGLY